MNTSDVNKGRNYVITIGLLLVSIFITNMRGGRGSD
jgi:hypothetical protein